MRKTAIDQSMLPNVWLTWETTKGQFWLECRTGKKTNVKPNIEFKWQNKTDILVKNGSHPYQAYAKYHKDMDMLEVAAVTIDTTRKEEVHEWKYAGNKYFIKKDKTVLDENGNICTGSFNLYKYHVGGTFKDFLSMFYRLSYSLDVVTEFKKFIGSSSYTIGNGRVVEIQYVWHIQDWYVKKQAVRNKGKAQKLIDTLTEMPVSDVSGLGQKYPTIEVDNEYGWYGYKESISGIMYFERLDNEWSVLRMFHRNDHDQLNEVERMYLNDNGTNRITTKTKNGWIPAKQFREWNTYYQFVNKADAMEKCNRLKYLVPLFEDSPKKIKRYLMTALRFPEIEQLIKLGHREFAKSIADSQTPRADMMHTFGEYYNDKETNLLRKIGLTKHQFDKHMNCRQRSSYYWNANHHVLTRMREWFENDLPHLDNDTFDKYYDAFRELSRYRFYDTDITQLGLDYKKFIKNVIRLGEKHENVYTMLHDTLNAYNSLNTGTEPEIEWYFDAYSDLVRAHDALTALYNAQWEERRAFWRLEASERQKKEEERRIKLDEERKKYEYEDDNYIIRLPKDSTEIINEGSKQHICIGSYVSSHSMGNTNLFFIRKKSEPDVPFYAIEMRNNAINQIHGYCNKWLGCDPDVIPTVIRWLRKNGITCSDKILTCKATGYGATNQYVPMPVVD